MPDRDMPNLGRERLIADARKSARIPRERREAPNPRYLLESAKALQISSPHSHPSGRSPGSPDGSEMKRRRSYETPSERRVRERAEAVRRYREAMRKRLEREGYLIEGIGGKLGQAAYRKRRCGRRTKLPGKGAS